MQPESTSGLEISRREFLRFPALVGAAALATSMIACAAPAPTASPAAPVPPTAAPAPTKVSETAKPALAPQTPAPVAKKPLQSIGARMGFRLSGYFAAFQAAIDRGYFAEDGLDLKVLEGTGSGPVLQLVASGEQAIGFLDAAVMIQGVQKGIGARMVACMFQQDMYGILSPADAPLKTPQDLIGKRLAGAPGSVAEVLWPAFAKKTGIDVDKVTFVNTDVPGRYQALLGRKVDGAFDQVPTGSLVYEVQNFPVYRLHYAEFGLVSLGNGIVLLNKTIRESPGMVRGFLAGLRKGWTYAIEHPTETSASATKAFPGSLNQEMVEKQWKAFLDFQRTPRTKDKPLWWMDKQDWEDTQTSLYDAGYVTEKRPVETYYTNEFLPSS